MLNILLSTYNGERFLPCQLDSLLAQDYSPLRLLVRDDGSHDGTCGIIRDYARRDSRVVFLNDPEKCGSAQNLGYRDSFMALLAHDGGADFYAFCDQDDLWLPEKARLGVEALRRAASSVPALYSSSFDYCDAELNKTAAPPSPSKKVAFRETLFYSYAFGFTIVMNAAMRRLALAFAPKCPSIPHDHLCEQLASIYGENIHDGRKTALYRRHGAAVTASEGCAGKLLASWLRNDIFGSTMATYRRYSRELLAALGDASEGERDAKRLLAPFAAHRANPAAYLRRILFSRRLRPTIPGEIALRLALALRP